LLPNGPYFLRIQLHLPLFSVPTQLRLFGYDRVTNAHRYDRCAIPRLLTTLRAAGTRVSLLLPAYPFMPDTRYSHTVADRLLPFPPIAHCSEQDAVVLDTGTLPRLLNVIFYNVLRVRTTFIFDIHRPILFVVTTRLLAWPPLPLVLLQQRQICIYRWFNTTP